MEVQQWLLCSVSSDERLNSQERGDVLATPAKIIRHTSSHFKCQLCYANSDRLLPSPRRLFSHPCLSVDLWQELAQFPKEYPLQISAHSSLSQNNITPTIYIKALFKAESLTQPLAQPLTAQMGGTQPREQEQPLEYLLPTWNRLKDEHKLHNDQNLKKV